MAHHVGDLGDDDRLAHRARFSLAGALDGCLAAERDVPAARVVDLLVE